MQAPSEFMRARRPDLFSDTVICEEQCLPKAVFEYHLETLTSRKQEYEFEHFCRKIAEKEICPNLCVQTGPTGGGDSKVDSETYPVAAEISERWWVGTPSAGSERWAFAFSAKKEWKPKIISDVKNILSTNRGYKRIYFFTNQFVSDKKRALQEDTLTKSAGIPVHIIERGWIIEKVYESGHLDLAIRTLGIEGVRSERKENQGPRDAERLAELGELDRQIADPESYRGARYQLVEDCLRTAILARGLERPRSEVERRFAQADRLASAVNYRQQRARIAYHRAWTIFWWYEDYSEFSECYDTVERLIRDADQACEVELLLNLWKLLVSVVNTEKVCQQEFKLDLRRDIILSMFETMLMDTARVNNALLARTKIAEIKLLQHYSFNNESGLKECWREFEEILNKSSTLGGYPVRHLAGIIFEISSRIDDSDFDSLYEKIVAVIRNRDSDGEAGVAFFERGTHKFGQGKPYDAIRWFGKAEELLVKEEYREELVRVLIYSSYAYERVGLLWAARNRVLSALELILCIFDQSGEMRQESILSARRLIWLELQLGRLPHVLSAVRLFFGIVSCLKLSDDDFLKCYDEFDVQDFVLGIHFLNTPIEEALCLQNIPDVLTRLELYKARMALLYVLGHEKILRLENDIPDSETSGDIRHVFEQWKVQPASLDIPSCPSLMNKDYCCLKSTLLGAELIFDVFVDDVSFGIAESVLGAIELFLATSNESDIVPHRESLKILLKPSEAVCGMPSIEISEDSEMIRIIHPVHMESFSLTSRKEYIEWIRHVLAIIMSKLFLFKDAESWLAKLAGDERAFGRALVFSDLITLNNNVFGTSAVLSLKDMVDPSDKHYSLLRSESWHETLDNTISKSVSSDDFFLLSSALKPVNPVDCGHVKHSDRRIFSPINISLWDKARWCAIAYVYHPSCFPCMGFIFNDGESGKLIFKELIERFGYADNDSKLRISIVKGLSKRKPCEYAVIIGPNYKNNIIYENKHFIFVSRVHRMTPDSLINVDEFVKSYDKFGKFYLMPSQFEQNSPKFFFENRILINKLSIREAWEIHEHDLDIVSLLENDDPIIPDGVENPPVHRALKRIKDIRLNK